MTIALLKHAQAIADERGMPKPGGDELIWGLRSVKADLTSREGYRWPFPGEWAYAPGPIIAGNDSPCPRAPGDGLCVATTWQGMGSGGYTAATLLLVGWHPADVLAADAGKTRAERVYVRDVIDGVNLVCQYGAGANLYEANLSGANLSRANLSEANLSGANLSGADLYGAIGVSGKVQESVDA